MTPRRARTFLKLLPVTAVFASTHIALAAVPATVSADSAASAVQTNVQPTLQSATVQSVDPADIAPAVETSSDMQSAADTRPEPDAAQVECVAKVILHEAGNQPRRGRMAVAQVIRARMTDGRFGGNACDVVRQPGQFFNVDAYRPSRHSDQWDDAVAIARETLKGEGDDVVPGALFFHSAGASMNGRTRLAQVADHTFYR